MRFLRFLLWLVAIGAASLWFIGFANRFQGFACVRVTHTCSSDDLRLQWHVLLWLAPPVCLVSLWLLRTSGRSSARFQRSPARAVSQRQAVPQGAQFKPAPMLVEGLALAILSIPWLLLPAIKPGLLAVSATTSVISVVAASVLGVGLLGLWFTELWKSHQLLP